MRAVYTGGTDPNYGDTYANATSNVIYTGVVRKSTETKSRCGHHSCKDTFRINPAVSIKGMHVKVQRKKGSKWHTVKQLKVTSKGTFTYAFPLGKTRVVLPAGRGFLSSYVTISVRRL